MLVKRAREPYDAVGTALVSLVGLLWGVYGLCAADFFFLFWGGLVPPSEQWFFGGGVEISLPRLSAAMTTPSLNLTARTDVPVTAGDCVCWLGPVDWR